MATIRKRGNSFHVQIRQKGYKTITKSFSDKDNALKWARKIESELERNSYLDYSKAQQTLLEEVLDRYLQEVLPNKRAGYSEITRIELLKIKLGYHYLIDLKPYLIAEYRDNRLELVKPATVKRELGLLSRVLNTTIKEWGITLPNGNPVSQIRLPKNPHGRDRRLEVNEEIKLIKALEHTPTVQSIVLFALETAMRREEITSMDWKDIDLT